MSTNHVSSDDMSLEEDFSHHNGTGTDQGLNPYDLNQGAQQLESDEHPGTDQGLNPYDLNQGAQQLEGDEHPGNAPKHIRTAECILSPGNRVNGDSRKTFGNPTPLAIGGFLLCLTPLSCDLMGWRGAGGSGVASTGVFFFFGCLLMILGAVGEWIIGNTFPFVVFGTFGSFWGAYGATLVPWYNAYGAYVTDPTVAVTNQGSPSNPAGMTVPAFNSSFGFFMVLMALLCFVFLICSLRTNVVFFVIFSSLVPAFICLAGAYFNLALFYENTTNVSASVTASRLVVAAGAFTFVTCLAGWWIFVAIVLASVDFPLTLPVGDLSTMFKGASERSDGGAG